MNLKLIGALFLALVARPAAAPEAKPYEVVYRATVSESLCLLLPSVSAAFESPSRTTQIWSQMG